MAKFTNPIRVLFILTFLSFSAVAQIKPRIVGGKKANNDYPWIVALVEPASRDPKLYNGQFGAGTLIAPGWILVSAHSVTSDHLQPVDSITSISTIDVAVNPYSLIKPQTGYSYRNVSQIIIHPDFNPKTSDNDIALIKLSSPVEQTPITLVAQDDETFTTTGVINRIIGWGETNSDILQSNFPDTLMQADVPIISNDDCNALESYDGLVTPNMICAGHKTGGIDACFNDSGGPLFHVNNDHTYVQVGIISWGFECGAPDFPGVYTKLSGYINWINKEISTVDGLSIAKAQFSEEFYYSNEILHTPVELSNGTLKVMDLSGREIFSTIINATETKLNLNTGIYIAICNSDTQVLKTKFVIEK